MKRLSLILPMLAHVACATVNSTGPALNEADVAASVAFSAECKAGLEKATAQFKALENVQGPRSVDSILEPLNDLWMTIDSGLGVAGLYGAVHPNGHIREAADTCEQEYHKLITTISLSRPLYDAVTAVDVSGEDLITRRYVKNTLRDFRRSGVDKDAAVRDRVRALKEELVQVGQTFGKNIRESVRTITLDSAEDLAGLPQDYIDAHKPDAEGKISISTTYPDYIPFMTYAVNDASRLALYKEFRKRGYPENGAVLDDLLAKRYELATLLGYKSWAHYITEDKMIKTDTAARDFIEKVASVSSKRAEGDYAELLARLQKEIPGATEVGDWQKSYIEELVKREAYQLDSQAIRQYFTYNKVRSGIFDITGKMFGVKYVPVKDAATWHPSVETYEIVDAASDEVIGKFHLDMHPRDNKYNHAAAFPLRSGVEGVQLPKASLVCNFPEGDELMEHGQVETFFHEFGHLLHHLFAGNHRWVGVSGFNTEWDFVEAPSQMLEEWAWDAASLKTFASDKDGNVIPDALIASMNRASDFGKGLWISQQMFYAAVSLNYYNRDPKGLDTTDMMKELQNRYSPYRYVDDTYFHYSFGHLDGYSAIYYTYMWSLVIAKDLFSVFEKDGLLNPDAAYRYRELILGPGGSKDAADMVRDFLGREYSFEAFSDWLNAG